MIPDLEPWRHRAQKSSDWIEQSLDDPIVIQQMLKLANKIVHPYVSEGTNSKPLIMTAGNGGSHALAEHLTAELIWRLGKDKDLGIPSICLTSNSSVLTALSNDLSYQKALVRHAATLTKIHSKNSDPILIGFSTSGHSKNILDLLTSVRYECNIHKVLFTGLRQEKELPASEVFYVKGPGVPTTAIIQEVHQVYVHILCEMISEKLKV